MQCLNKSLPIIQELLAEGYKEVTLARVAETLSLNDKKRLVVNDTIKDGVSNLFESNPELANAVYEALGIEVNNFKLIPNKEKHPEDANTYDVIYNNEKIGIVALFEGKNKVIKGVKLDEKFRNKGLGKKLYKFLNLQANLQGGVLFSDPEQQSADARRLWNSLIKEGVVNIATADEQSLKFNIDYKQQAQEQYSQYLDTIFPDSKVKDILYHGTPDGRFDSFDISKSGKTTFQPTQGIYFTDSKKTADFYAEGSIDFSQFESLEEYESVKTAKVFSVFINAKELKLVDSPQAQKKQGDVVLRTKEKLSDKGFVGEVDYAYQYIVFSPEQIHILGSNQDIEGFKKFVKYNKSNNNELNISKKEIIDKYNTLLNDNTFLQSKSISEELVNWLGRNLGSKYYVNKYGIIDTLGKELSDADKTRINERITYLNSAYRQNFRLYRTSTGKYGVANLSLQLSTDANSKSTSSKVSKSLNKFIEAVGINIETIENFKERFGIDGVALADILNRVIYVANGKAGVDTLPEEAGHFFVELLPENHPLLVAMMREITSYDIYQEVVDEYSEVYNGDVNKLKREAIGKLIAREILADRKELNDGGRFNRWWHKVWSYIKGVFSNHKANIELLESTDSHLYNPYREAAIKILKGDVTDLQLDSKKQGQYYQLSNSKQLEKSEAYDKLRAIIVKKEVRDDKGNLSEDYFVNGVSREDLNLTRATTAAKGRYKYANRDGYIDVDDVFALQGTMIHEMVGHIINDVQLLREGKTPIGNTYVQGTPEYIIYAKLKSVFKPWAEAILDEGGIIKIEQPILNTELGYIGTIDILVINKDGSEDIYDIKTRNAKEVTFAKREEYSKQLDIYKQMVTKGDPNYGLVPSKVNKTRIFGMQLTRTAGKALKGIVLDNTNLVVADEVSGEESIDEQLEVLRYRLKRLEFRFQGLYESSEKIQLGEKIAAIQNLIDELVTTKDVSLLIDFGQSELTSDAVRLSNNIDNLTYEELQSIYYNTIIYENLDINTGLKSTAHLQAFMQLSSEAKLLKKLALNKLKAKLTKDAQQNNQLGNKNVTNFLVIDTPQSKYNAWVRGASFSKDDYVRMSNDIIVTAREKARIRFEDYTEKLKEAIDKFLSKESDYSKIINPATGDLYAKFKKEFFQAKEKAKRNKDWEWYNKHYIVTDAVKEKYEEMLERQREVYKTLPDVAVQKKYNRLGGRYEDMGLSKREALLAEWKVNNPIIKFGDLKNEEEFYSEDYKTINNTPHLKEFYDFWTSSMYEFGRLTGKKLKPNMVANVKTDILERIASNPSDAVKSMFTFDWLIMNDTDNQSEDYYDPITKERLYKVPLLYVNQDYSKLIEKYKKLGNSEEKATELAKQEFIDSNSKDLGGVMYAFAGGAFTNQAMQEVEHQIAALKILASNLSVENVDKSLSKDKIEEAVKNIHLTQEQVTDLMEVYVYGKKDNSSKENEGVKETLDKINKFTSISRLAFNAFSPVTNLLGGVGNAYMMAAKKMGFNDGQLTAGFGRHINQDDKTKAFYKLFPVLMEEFMKSEAANFTINNRGKYLNQDNSFLFQRIGDKSIQFGVLNAMLQSHTVVDGKIVNIVKHLKQKYNYSNFMPANERMEVLKKVEEEAKTVKSLYELAEVKDGKIDIESLGVTEDDIIKFKRKVTKTNKFIIGNTDPNDLAMIKRNMVGRMFMTFRSWIQALADERFMDKYYDADLEETIEGRYKTLFNLFKEQGLQKTIALQLGLTSRLGANLTDEQIAALQANARELQLIVTAILAYILTHLDDDDEKSGIIKYLAKISDRLVDELTFFINPKAVFDIVSSPVAASSTIKDLFYLFGEGIDFIHYGIFGTDAEYEEKVKLKRATVKLIPIIGQAQKLEEVVVGQE